MGRGEEEEVGIHFIFGVISLDFYDRTINGKGCSRNELNSDLRKLAFLSFLLIFECSKFAAVYVTRSLVVTKQAYIFSHASSNNHGRPHGFINVYFSRQLSLAVQCFGTRMVAWNLFSLTTIVLCVCL